MRILSLCLWFVLVGQVSATHVTLGTCAPTDAAVNPACQGVPHVMDAGVVMLLPSGNCPSGWTDMTATHQGFYVGIKPATGTVGDTLGTAIPTSTTNASYTPAGTISAPTLSCTATANFVTTGGLEPACDNSPAPTASTPTLTGTANATMRSTIAPVKWFKLCQKD